MAKTKERDTHIGPKPPDDDRKWLAQCARCGSSMDWRSCTNCAGEGTDGHDCGEDVCCCAFPEENVPCDTCGGEGGWYKCMSAETFCNENPLAGREQHFRDAIEWFATS